MVTPTDPWASWEPTTGANVKHHLDRIVKRRSYTGIEPTWRASCECWWCGTWTHSPQEALDQHVAHQAARTYAQK